MGNNNIQIALLGCGRVAQHHRKILTSGTVNGFDVSACCDTNRAAAENLAATFGAEIYTDSNSFFDNVDADVIVILTPSGMHYEHAKAALEAGRNVLVEKPITLIPEQAYELIDLADRKGLMYSVIFQNRFNSAIQLLRRTLDEGRFGKIITATIRLRWCRYQDYYEDGWHGTWAQDGGVINQQAIHHIDALNWLCGPVESLSATMGRRLNELEAEDTLVASLRFENGALGTIEATTAARPEDFEASLSVVGEKGMAVIGGIALNIVDTWSFVESRPEDEGNRLSHSQEVPTGYGLSHGPYLQATIDGLLANKTNGPISGQEGVKALELVHALYTSCETNSWTNIADKPRSKRLGQSKGQ